MLSGMRLPVMLQLPDDVRNLKEPTTQELTDSVLTRYWIEAGPNGLAGKRIEFPGLQGTITDVLVRVEMLDGRSWTTIVHPSQPWVEITAAQTRCEVMGTFVVQGIRHILFGADHMLFVLGLLLIVKDRWMLLKTITAFTVAHSITLAIATLGYAEAPSAPAECGHRAQHPLSRPGDRALVARGNQLHHPSSVGGCLRFRPAARIRIRQRPHQRRTAEGRTARSRYCPSMWESRSDSFRSSHSSSCWSAPSASSKCAGRAGPKRFPATPSAHSEPSGRCNDWLSALRSWPDEHDSTQSSRCER